MMVFAKSHLFTSNPSLVKPVQVFDLLTSLLCRRPPPCVEALGHAGWLLHQLLPESGQITAARLERISVRPGSLTLLCMG
jgi:hypothetical protein